MLQSENDNPHHSHAIVSILDFLYFGEANVYLEDLDSFLAIAEEIQLKGWTGQSTSTKLVKEQESNSLFSDERLSVIGRSFIWEKQNNEKG